MHVKAQQIGVANTTRGMDTGLMGIGLGNTTPATNYPNIIDQLALQNITNSRAFSLDLGTVDTPEGKFCKLDYVCTLLTLARFHYLWRCRHKEVLRRFEQAPHCPSRTGS